MLSPFHDAALVNIYPTTGFFESQTHTLFVYVGPPSVTGSSAPPGDLGCLRFQILCTSVDGNESP